MSFGGRLTHFTYDSRRGRHPKEKPKEIHVKRTDPITKKIKIKPSMLAPINDTRKFIPAHRLVEEDYRLYRNAYHAQLSARMVRPPAPYPYQEQEQAQVQGDMLPISMIQDVNLPPIELTNGNQMMPPPPVQQYNDNDRRSKKAARKHIPIPLAVFKGPFDSMLHVPDCVKYRQRVPIQQPQNNKGTPRR